jgi:hypothetical protein
MPVAPGFPAHEFREPDGSVIGFLNEKYPPCSFDQCRLPREHAIHNVSGSWVDPAQWTKPANPAPPVPDRVLPAPERDPDVGLPPWHRDKHEYLRRQVERPAWKDEVLTCPNCDAEFFSAQDAVVTSLGEDQPRNAARVPIHAFKGRSDRPCEMCGKPDRNPVHDERYG